jgi:hypothetical protein
MVDNASERVEKPHRVRARISTIKVVYEILFREVCEGGNINTASANQRLPIVAYEHLRPFKQHL